MLFQIFGLIFHLFMHPPMESGGNNYEISRGKMQKCLFSQKFSPGLQNVFMT